MTEEFGGQLPVTGTPGHIRRFRQARGAAPWGTMPATYQQPQGQQGQTSQQGTRMRPEWAGWQPAWQNALQEAQSHQQMSLRRLREGSVDGFDSVPHTPDSQVGMPFEMPSYTMHRFGSVSSVTTTDEEDSNAAEYPWSDAQDAFIHDAYDALVNDPRTTPFSGRFPPSGVVQRVAKDTLKLAKRANAQFPHSLTAVRHRVLLLYSRSAESLDVSVDDIPEPLGSEIDVEAMEVDAGYESLDDEFQFEDEGRPRPARLSYEDAALPPPGAVPLQAPFKEASRPRQDGSVEENPTSEDIVNIVAKRKRDSLRMKRGVR